MIRALIASGIIHATMLCFAHFGVGPTLGWLGGVLSLGWEFILAICLAILAFLLVLLFGLSALAGMGAAAAVALVVAAVGALTLVDRMPGDTVAREMARAEAERRAAPPRPLDVAMVGDPAVPRNKAEDDKTLPAPPAPSTPDDKVKAATVPPPPAESESQKQMFSATFGAADRNGISKVGRTVKGKLWTVELPSAINSAAERLAGDAMTRRRLSAGAKDTDPAATPPESLAKVAPATDQPAAEATPATRQQATVEPAAALQTPADPARADEGQQGEADRARDSAQAKSPPATGKGVWRRGVTTAFDEMARAMPRLGEFRRRLAAAANDMQQMTQKLGAAESNSERQGREAVMQRVARHAEEGYAHAQFNLAEMLLTSPGGKDNFVRARGLLERAAIGGYVPAQVLLAMLEGEGSSGTRADPARAHAWLSVAAARGNKAVVAARDDIARQLRDGEEVAARLEAAALKRMMAAVAPAAGAEGDRKQLTEQLRHAAVLGDSEAVHVLLARNADADDADQDGRTPLIEAAWRGYPGIVDALVRAGAKIDARDSTGKTSVAWAAINGHGDVIEKLVAAGSPVDIPDDEGFTPLMRAAWNGHADAVRALLRAGARPEARNRQGRSAADYARVQRSESVLRELAGR